MPENSYHRILSNRGMTLVEVMVAGSICAVVFLISMTIAAEGYAKSKSLRNHLQSNFALSYIANSLAIAPSNDPRLTPGTHSIECSIYACPVANGGVPATWTVTANEPSVGFIQIDISVGWKNVSTQRSVRTKFTRSVE